MKKTIMTFALAAMCCVGAQAQEKLFNSASVQSPVVNADGTVTFNLFAPKAVKVEVTGDFLPTQPIEIPGYGKYDAPGVAQLKEGKNGVWSYTTDKLAPEMYSYTFNIDGMTGVKDPANIYVNRDIVSFTNIFIVSDQKGIDALEYLKRLYNEDLYVVGDVNVFMKDKNAAFLTTESYYATHFTENNESNYLPGNDITYGFINYPQGPNGDENCVSAYVHKVRRLNWVIKYSGNELSDIGIFLDRMFEPIDDEGGWRTSLERYVFFDQRDFDNYSFMLEHINYRHDLDLGENASSKMDDAFTNVITHSRSATEAFNSIRTVVNEAIAANVNWVYEDIVAQQ